jgi:hypothetical protein
MVERNDQWEHYFLSLEEYLYKIPMGEEEMVKEVMTHKTHVLGELKKYAVFALSYLYKALELHFKNTFRKWCFMTYIYKQKTFKKFFRG